jgi:hypothetical protein
MYFTLNFFKYMQRFYFDSRNKTCSGKALVPYYNDNHHHPPITIMVSNSKYLFCF